MMADCDVQLLVLKGDLKNLVAVKCNCLENHAGKASSSKSMLLRRGFYGQTLLNTEQIHMF